MKKLTLVFVVLAFVTVNRASAEMVDIGLGEMERSDFMALKAKVQGQQLDIVPVFATPPDRPQRYGMVEMTHADFKSLGEKIAGHNVSVDDKPAVKAVQMVNIGTGEMPMDEFIALRNMVDGRNDGQEMAFGVTERDSCSATWRSQFLRRSFPLRRSGI